jgi:hypothetical protein
MITNLLFLRTAQLLLRKLLDMAQQVASTPMTPTLINTKQLLGKCFAYCFAELLPLQSLLMCDTNWNLPEAVISKSSRRSKLSEQVSHIRIGVTMVKVLKNYIETEESFAVVEAASNLLKDIFSSVSPLRWEKYSTLLFKRYKHCSVTWVIQMCPGRNCFQVLVVLIHTQKISWNHTSQIMEVELQMDNQVRNRSCSSMMKTSGCLKASTMLGSAALLSRCAFTILNISYGQSVLFFVA